MAHADASASDALLPDWATSPALTAALLALLLLLALFAAWMTRLQRRRQADANRRRGTVAVRVAAVAALGCTAYSADTSWRFAAEYLDMGSTVERVFVFATAELALFATALMARQNLNGPAQAPGLPGVLVWVITAVQLIPAYAESGLVGGTVRALIGPVMAAMLWHLAMGIELRHRTPDAASRSLAAILMRQTRERLLARLRIADRDADARRIIREQALSEAVTLILRVESMTDRQRGRRRGRRLTERLHDALERADVDGDSTQDALLLRKLATRKQALGLASITLPPRWSAPASSAAGQSVNGQRHADGPRPTTRAAGAALPQARPTAGQETGTGTTGSPSSLLGARAGSASGRRRRTSAARSRPEERKPRASDEDILHVIRRMYEETNSVGRDRVEEALREAGFSVSSDDAGRVVRDFKNNLTAALNDSAT
jgi:hypothetical protein